MKRIWTPDQEMRSIRARELVKDARGRLVRPQFFLGSRSTPGAPPSAPEFVTSMGDDFFEAVATATTPTTSPAATGSNLYAFGGLAVIDSGGVPVLSGMSYDDDGTPVAMTRLLADQPFSFSNAALAPFGVAGVPAEATEFTGTWDVQRLVSIVNGAIFRNVNQTTPITGVKATPGANGDPTPNIMASITFTSADPGFGGGINDGDLFVAAVAYSSLSASASGFTEQAGTTLCPNSAWFLTGGSALVYGYASGGSCTLTLRCNHASDAGMTWVAAGGRLNPV